MIVENAIKKRMHKEKTESDYLNKFNKLTLDITKSIDDLSPSSGRNKYKDRVDRMLATQNTPQPSK
jgi:hypothetical protein